MRLTEPYYWTSFGFTGASDGGFTAYGSESIRADYGPDGTFRGIAGAPTVFPAHTGTMGRVDASSALVGLQDGVAVFTTRDAGRQTRDFLLPVGFADLPPVPAVLAPAWTRRVSETLPAIHPESGRATWLGTNYVASACISTSRVAWVVEYDPPPFGWSGTAIQALADGSVVVAAGHDFVRLSPEGDVLARRRELAVWGGLTEACGMVVRTGELLGQGYVRGTERVERWSPADFTTTLSVPLDHSRTGRHFADASLGPDCAIQLSRLDLGDGTGAATRALLSYAPDGSLAWTLEDYQGWGPRIPLADAGFLSFSFPTRVTAYNADATIRWYEQYSGGNWIGGGLLMPDGTLYALVEGADGRNEFLAINVGVGAAPLAYAHSGANWARTSGPLQVD